MTINVDGRVVANGRPIAGGSMYDNGVQTLDFTGLPTLWNNQTVSIYWVSTTNASYGSNTELTKNGTAYTYTIQEEMSAYESVKAFINITDGTNNWNTQEFIIKFNKLFGIGEDTSVSSYYPAWVSVPLANGVGF